MTLGRCATLAHDVQRLRKRRMNTGLAFFAADGISEDRKKRNIPQAKPGEPEFIGIAIRAQHGSITKDHSALDAALVFSYGH